MENRERAKARDKKQKRPGGEKLRNAIDHQGENERQQKKSEREHIQNFLHKTCNKKVSGSFDSSCRRAKQRQRNVQKKCVARAKLFFC